MGDVSEESLLRYFYSLGGKVKNSDLLQTFDQFVNNKDLQLRAKYREKFKHAIDRIAVFKVENGEKYLILKKKYKQCKQVQKCQTSSQCPAIVPVAKKEKTGQVEWSVGPSITVTEAQEPNEMKSITKTCGLMEESPESVIEEHPGSTDAEDELEKDLGSKSESEQEEDSTGSLGSAHVTLDPTEKEWIYHAACGRLSHLKQLLKQDASLANKKDFTSGFTALHWAAKHGKEDMLSAMADAGADVNTKAHGGYTPLHIAALHGHFQIVDLLTRVYGAKENVRDYSGHLASHYMCPLKKTKEDDELTPEYHSPAQVTERRNRKLTSLFHSRKKWGSAEDLAPVPEERSGSHQLMIPAFRPRKFSR